jgi:Flp pilus assembly protein TadG
MTSSPIAGPPRRRSVLSQRGQSLVEFTVVTVLTLFLLLAVFECSRMVLVYNTVASAARAGMRYACVHGSTRTGSGAAGPSGPSANPAQVLTVVRNFASAGLLNTGNLIISATYPGGSNAPGQTVVVSVIYPYDAFVTYFPIHPRLGSATQGVIAF